MFGRMSSTLDDLSDVDCLMCGSRQSCDLMLYSDREEWSNSFCNLLSISDPEVARIFSLSYYCTKCYDDLRKVNQWFRQITELNEKLRNIKNKCVFKLDHCVEESKMGRFTSFQAHVERRAQILPHLKESQKVPPVASATPVVHVITEKIVEALSDQMINISPDQIINVSGGHILRNTSQQGSSHLVKENEQMLSGASEQMSSSTIEPQRALFNHPEIVLSERDGTLSVQLVMADSSASQNDKSNPLQISSVGPDYPESWFPQDNFVESEIEIKTDADLGPRDVAITEENNDSYVHQTIEHSDRDASNNDTSSPAGSAFGQNKSIIEQAMELANDELISDRGESNLLDPDFAVSEKEQSCSAIVNCVSNAFAESLAETELALENSGELVGQNHPMPNLSEDLVTLEATALDASGEVRQSVDSGNVGETKTIYDEDYYRSDEENMDKDPFSLTDQEEEEEYGSSVSTVVSDDEENPATQAVKGQHLPPSTSFSDVDASQYKELKAKYKLKELSVRLQRPYVIKIVNIANLLNQSSSTAEDASTSTKVATSPTVPCLPSSNIADQSSSTEDVILSFDQKTLSAENIKLENFFQCTHEGCRMRFRLEVQKEAHIKRVHEGVKRPYQCSVCDMNFVTYKQFNFHQNAHESKHPYLCITCGRGFEDRQQLVDHIDITGHHPNSLMSIPCPEQNCYKKFIDEIRRDAHVKKSHEGIKYPYECTTCCKKFTCYRYLKDHENHHAEIHPYTCEVCGRKFYSQLRLREHMKYHGAKNLQCEYCGKEFVLRGRYNVHLRTHTKERPFVCEVCGKGFTQRKYLRYHLPVHPELNLEKAVCKICNKIFSHNQTLRIHELQHTGEFKYRCTICNFGAPSQYAVNNHMAKHTDNRVYSCQLCDKKFKTVKYMKMHVKQQHAENKASHDCTSCGKKLRSRIGLLRHQALHGDSFPFVCSVCGKCYPLKYYLDSHTAKCWKKETKKKERIVGEETLKNPFLIEKPIKQEEKATLQSKIVDKDDDNR